MTAYELLDIPLASRTGTSALPTKTYGEVIAPGLAITPGLWGDDSPRFNGGWHVTHIGSGTLISGGNNLHCLACTREYGQAAIDSGIDWTAPQPEISALIAAKTENVEGLLAALRELRTCLGTECDRGFVCGDPGL